jgi:SNF2 family DNA or RNA helicase
LSIPLNYNLPLVLYYETFLPSSLIHPGNYDVPNMSAYYILGAISTFYQSQNENGQTYMSLLGDNIWFRGLAKYKDGYRIVLDTIPYIKSVPMQGVGLRPIQKPNVPSRQQIIPIQNHRPQVKAPQVIIPQKIVYSPTSPTSPRSTIVSPPRFDITSPPSTSPGSIISSIGSPLTIHNVNDRIQRAYPETSNEIIEEVPSGPPKLFLRQIPHFNKLDSILQRENCYLDNSVMGAGKTFVSLSLAKKYGFKIIVVAPLAVLSKWVSTAKLFEVEIKGICTYQSLRGTKIHQPNNIFLTRDGNNFNVTPAFEQIVREGVLLIFDEVQNVKNETAQLEAAATLCRTIADMNQRRESNSRIGLLSATPADKQKQAASLLRMLTIVKGKSMYYYDQSNKRYVPTGFNEVYNWCRKVNMNLADHIRMGKLNKKTITLKLFEFMTQIVIFQVGSSMDAPEINIEQDYKNGFYHMSPIDSQDLINGVGALRYAIAKLQWLSRGEHEVVQSYDQNAINAILQGHEGIAAVTFALMAIEHAKLSTVIRLARQQLEQDPNCKVILYFNYHESLNEAMAALRRYNPVQIHGGMKTKQRDISLELFQQDNNNCRVLIGITRVGSVGIDLDDKFGNHPRFMYIIPDYRFIDLYQATGRIYRLSTRSKATVRFIYGQSGVIESNILDAIERKTITTKQYILTQHPAPFPGDFEEYIEPLENYTSYQG